MKLLKLSLIISLLGILILLIISNEYEPRLTKINQLTTNQLNKNIKIQAQIIKSIKKPNSQILTLRDSTGQVLAIINSKKSLPTNKTLMITGKLQEYNQELEISINKILS